MTTLGEMFKRKSQGLCPFCGAVIHHEDFMDEPSYAEFCISGLCQTCQDKFFE
jgi:hypothetical protein